MTVRDLVGMLRPHQWAKNALTLIPVVASGHWATAGSWLGGAAAFAAFSMMASAGYVINDLRDIAEDRTHLTKRARPIAAGRVPVGFARVVAMTLIVAGFGVSTLAGSGLRWIVLLYLVGSILYTAILKKYFLADAIVLAALFTTRILGGCAAIGVRPSIWLLSVSMFVFFSLALTKRVRELQAHSSATEQRRSSRDYDLRDLDLLRSVGVSSATVAVLVIGLYVESARPLQLYREAAWLWVACPIIWYWLLRVWFKCDRGELHDDPVVFALRDRTSWLCFGAIVLCWAAAIVGVPTMITR